MIARIIVLLPYSINVFEGQIFNTYSYVEGGYEVKICPLKQSKSVKKYDQFPSAHLSALDNIPIFQANLIQVEFVKEIFDRRDDIYDPPLELINHVINRFLIRLRFITREPQIKQVKLPMNAWAIQYYNDDGTQVPKEKGLTRYRSSSGMVRFAPYSIMNSQMWEDIKQLPHDFVPPEWDSLLLDANYLLPEIGPSIVLAMTALEVFISKILNSLAEKSSISQEIWAWINNRDWWLKQPAVEEQFDALLKSMAHFSLKEDKGLWEAFSHLKRARNSFVHDGVAKLGGQLLRQADAYRLVKAAGGIIEYVRERLPEEFRWPQLRY